MKICDVEFEIMEGPVGISCSGGADSSILLYMLMLNKIEKIHIFTLASNFKQRKNVRTSCEVIDKCIELTGNDNIEHHISFCDEQNINNMLAKPKDYLLREMISFIYTGITANPPQDVLNTFYNKLDTKDLNHRDSSIKDVFVTKFYMPFRNINKKKIAELYVYHDLLESLFPITRSCEWTSHYKGDDPGYGHCDKCWWCEERNWAFKGLRNKL